MNCHDIVTLHLLCDIFFAYILEQIVLSNILHTYKFVVLRVSNLIFARMGGIVRDRIFRIDAAHYHRPV